MDLRNFLRIFYDFECSILGGICQVYLLDAAQNPRTVYYFHGNSLGSSRISSTSCETFLGIYGILGESVKFIIFPFLGSYDLSAIWFLGRLLMGLFCDETHESSILVQCAQINSSI